MPIEIFYKFNLIVNKQWIVTYFCFSIESWVNNLEVALPQYPRNWHRILEVRT
jgi:hypothetical protein